MKKSILILLILTSDLCTLSARAAGSAGDSSSSGFAARAQSREASRWTLQEWMEQKSKIQLMDMWLSMHSPSPYEFSFKAAYLSYKTTSTNALIANSENISSSGRLDAYAQLVGLSLEHQHNVPENFSDTTGILNLRLLGNSSQNSNLTLHWGLRTRELTRLSTTTKIPQQFGQASLSLHLTKALGIQGLYRNYQSYKEATFGDCGGTYSEAGIYIDFAAIRVFGNWYKEESTYKLTTETTDTREGISSGLQFFF